MFFLTKFFILKINKGGNMTKKLEMYKCEICGNFVEVVLAGEGELVCCGQPMKLLVAGLTDGSFEKHVPFFSQKEDGVEIRIGEELHPMSDEHYIQFIEVISRDEKYVKRKYLYPGEEPSLKLKGFSLDTKMKAREHCNIHGLWEANND